MPLKNQKTNISKQKKEREPNFFFRNYPFFIIVAVGLILYLKTTSYSYSPLDDTLLIKNRMEWLLDKTNFSEAFTRGTFTREDSHAPDYYRPILTLSFKLDAIISNGKIGYFHFSNILLHIIASIILFLVLKRFSFSEKNAFVFALLFTIHPAFVHAVAWVPGRNDTLLAIFTFASVFFYLGYSKENKPIAYILSLLCYLLALFTKENIVFLPLLLLAFDYVTHNKIRYKQILTALPGLIIVTAFWWIVRSKIVSTAVVVYAIEPLNAIVKSIAPLILYIGKVLIPFNQSVLPNVSDTSIIPGLIVLAAFLFLSIRYRFKNWKIALLGIGWFVIFLLIPLLYITMTGEGLQYEHRLYVPMLGIILAISQLNFTIPKQTTVIAIILVLFSVKTIARSGVYENTLTFAQAAVSESPSLAMSHNMMGIEYNNAGDYKNAIDEYTRALDIEPEKYTAMFNRASTFNNMKEYNLALKDYNKGLAKDSLNAKAIFDRGNVYSDMGNYSAAIADYNKAISIYPQYSNAYNNRGNVYANLKDFPKAIEDYTKAIEFRKTNVNAYNNRANAYSSIKEYSKALEDMDKALMLRPNDKDFIQNRKAIMAEIKSMQNQKSGIPEMKLSMKEEQLLPEAYKLYKSRDYNKAKDIFYQLYVDAKSKNQLQNAASHYNNVGLCYIRTNNFAEAEKALQSIIAFYPNYEKTYLNLGLLYTSSGNKKLATDFYKRALEINPNNLNTKAKIEQLSSNRGY